MIGIQSAVWRAVFEYYRNLLFYQLWSRRRCQIRAQHHRSSMHYFTRSSRYSAGLKLNISLHLFQSLGPFPSASQSNRRNIIFHLYPIGLRGISKSKKNNNLQHLFYHGMLEMFNNHMCTNYQTIFFFFWIFSLSLQLHIVKRLKIISFS